ncbi:hypothetical protein CRENBAI_013986 [Crenichthys baileyi]|uniref:Uncharacterized protein n=1 Tax=Crenichthys baileyi TaxID=28760 RepID=A0AAV9SBM5_9TELE
MAEVVDLYWGVDPEEWDNPDLQRLRMNLLEECLKTSAGPCFVVTSISKLLIQSAYAEDRDSLSTREVHGLSSQLAAFGFQVSSGFL